jgi:hypothetical protein
MKKYGNVTDHQLSGYRASEKFRERVAARLDDNGKPKKAKRPKAGFFIFTVNIIVIAVLVVFVYNQKSNYELYKTIPFKTEQCDFRFSIATKNNSDNYAITLTAKSSLENETTLFFNKNAANIDFIYNDKIVLSVPIGNNITELNLKPTEVKTFATPVNMKELNSRILEKGDYKPKRRKHLFDFEGTSVMVKAKLTLNTPDEISQTLEFRTGNLK